MQKTDLYPARPDAPDQSFTPVLAMILTGREKSSACSRPAAIAPCF
jgi:hypothetical protein